MFASRYVLLRYLQQRIASYLRRLQEMCKLKSFVWCITLNFLWSWQLALLALLFPACGSSLHSWLNKNVNSSLKKSKELTNLSSVCEMMGVVKGTGWFCTAAWRSDLPQKWGWLPWKSELMLLLVVLFEKTVQLLNLSLSLFLWSALTDDSEGKNPFTCINMALDRCSCYSHP